MDLAKEQRTDVSQLEKKDERRIVRLLESCTVVEVCEALGGNVKLLTELRNKLRDWLTLQPHLPQDISDEKLENFLISTKLSLELAKPKLDMYYTVRRLVPELFANRDPSSPDFAQLRETLQWICLPKLTPNKSRVYIMRLVDGDVSKFHPWTFFKYTFMVADVKISESRNLNEVYIYDLGQTKLAHYAKITPGILKKCEIVATKAYGARIKEIHFVNTPSFVDRVVTLVKSAIKPKLASRIHVHSLNFETVYDFVPKSILPADYGGDQPTMKQLSECWDHKLKERRDWFLAQQKITVNESLRPGPSVDADEVFGFSGSFRKLEVD